LNNVKVPRLNITNYLEVDKVSTTYLIKYSVCSSQCSLLSLAEHTSFHFTINGDNVIENC